MELEAWFDGEAPVDDPSDELSWHAANCAKCFRHLETLSNLRVAVRGSLGAATPADASVLDLATLRAEPAWHRWSRPIVAVAAALLVIAAVVGASQIHLHSRLASDRSAASGRTSSSKGSTGSGSATKSSATSATSGSATQSRGSSSSSGTASGSTGHTTVGPGSPTAGALTLAVIVPTVGTDAAEGTEVADAVRQAVAAANASGGVDGVPVQLTVVPAEDSAAIAALPGHVTAVVGGFGADPPASVPWLLPADPYASGANVVAAELSPAEAGARLGQELVQQGDTGTVGVVVGTGPDAALESGLAQEVPVSTVTAPSTGACLPALATLQAQGVDAVAVAGPPTLAASCVAALSTLLWAPAAGVLLAPSAAYDGVTSAGIVPGAALFTVLGLPWPGSSSPGAALFRSVVPGDSSYQALVSFAAVEMAVQVARSVGVLTLHGLAAGTWQNSLYNFAGADNVGAQVVEQSAGNWVSAA